MIRKVLWSVVMTAVQVAFFANDVTAQPRPGSLGSGIHGSPNRGGGGGGGSGSGPGSGGGGRGWQSWVIDVPPPLPSSSGFPAGNVNVPPSASCPPRCPDDNAWSVFAPREVAPVYALNEKYEEMREQIADLQHQLEIDKKIRKALETLARNWLVEYRLPAESLGRTANERIQNEARSRIKAEAHRRISDAMSALLDTAIRARQTQLGEAMPFFWDVRPSAYEKQRILESTIVELNHAQQFGTNGIQQKLSNFDSGTRGHVLWHGSEAMGQAQKVERERRWKNQ